MKRFLLAAVLAVAIASTAFAQTGKAIISLPLQRTAIVGAEVDLWTAKPFKRLPWFSLNAMSFTGEDLTTNKAAAGGSVGVRLDGLGAFVFAGFSGYTEPSQTLVWGKFTVTIGGKF